MVLMYALPPSIVGERMTRINNSYIEPLFYLDHQYPPAQQIPFQMEMEGRVYTNGNWTNWERPVEFKTDENGSLERAYHRVKYWLHKESVSPVYGVYFVDGVRMDDRLERSVAYYAAHLFADRYFVQQGIADADSVQVKLVYEQLWNSSVTKEIDPSEFVLNPLAKP